MGTTKEGLWLNGQNTEEREAETGLHYLQLGSAYSVCKEIHSFLN